MNKITAYLLIAVVILGGLLWFQQKRLTHFKNEKERSENNFINAQFKVDSLKTKNDEAYYSVKQLVVDKDELIATNADLFNTLSDMKLKIKNLESSTRIEYKYIIKKDTIYLQPENPENPNGYRWKAIWADAYIEMKATVVLEEPQPYIENVNIELSDSLTIANEFITKQKWFLFIPCGKKVIGCKTFIKSENPYFKLDRVETYQFKNKRNKKKLQ